MSLRRTDLLVTKPAWKTQETTGPRSFKVFLRSELQKA